MNRSPLHSLHEELGARFVDFGGWEMPVEYESVLAEHRAVRTSCGMFDVTHLGRFRWEGPGATGTMRRLLCNDVLDIEPGRTQYTMMLNEAGGVVDDLVVWRWGEDAYWVLPNAANHGRVMEAFRRHDPELDPVDLRSDTVMLAVQGPEAPGVIESVLGEAPKRFRTLETRRGEAAVWTAGTGYTGERGGEVVVAAGDAPEVARAFFEVGAVPCGLGSRDTLRLEAGLPLWGQDLDETITPLEAGLDFAVSFGHDFVGEEALEAQRREGVPKTLVGFSTGSRQIPRPGYRLRAGGSTGWVTSGNFSPMLGCGIGMGYLEPPTEGPLEVEIRGRWLGVTRVAPPFVD